MLETLPILKSYRIARGWRLFIYILVPPLLAVFVYMAVLPFLGETKNPLLLGLLFTPLSLGLIGLLGYGLLETIRTRVVITADSLVSQEAIKSKRLHVSEIKGYQTDKNYLLVRPVREDLPTIRLSHYLERFAEIQNWLALHFPNLDQEALLTEELALLADERLGRTEEERGVRLAEARRITRLLNGASLLLVGWALFKPVPYELVTGIAMAFPLVGLLTMQFYKGLVRVNEEKNSAYPSLLTALAMSSGAVFLRAMLDFHVLEMGPLWPPLLASTALLVICFLAGTREFSFRKPTHYLVMLLLALLLAGYSYGSLVVINCFYDQSTPVTYPAKVLDRRISKGKTTTYYLELTSWGPRTAAESVSVPRDFYEQMRVGSPVTVYLFSGYLRIPWFAVEKQ